MRVRLLLILLLVAGCDGTKNTYEVHAPKAVSADLLLCGQILSLRPTAGDNFKGSFPIHCEGDGAIKVKFAEQAPIDCKIGYVTPGMAQDFHFEVKDGRCEPSA